MVGMGVIDRVVLPLTDIRHERLTLVVVRFWVIRLAATSDEGSDVRVGLPTGSNT